jgi:hypothetical protein
MASMFLKKELRVRAPSIQISAARSSEVEEVTTSKPHHERSDWWGWRLAGSTPTNRCGHGGAKKTE